MSNTIQETIALIEKHFPTDYRGYYEPTPKKDKEKIISNIKTLVLNDEYIDFLYELFKTLEKKDLSKDDILHGLTIVLNPNAEDFYKTALSSISHIFELRADHSAAMVYWLIGEPMTGKTVAANTLVRIVNIMVFSKILADYFGQDEIFRNTLERIYSINEDILTIDKERWIKNIEKNIFKYIDLLSKLQVVTHINRKLINEFVMYFENKELYNKSIEWASLGVLPISIPVITRFPIVFAVAFNSFFLVSDNVDGIDRLIRYVSDLNMPIPFQSISLLIFADNLTYNLVKVLERAVSSISLETRLGIFFPVYRGGKDLREIERKIENLFMEQANKSNLLNAIQVLEDYINRGEVSKETKEILGQEATSRYISALEDGIFKKLAIENVITNIYNPITQKILANQDKLNSDLRQIFTDNKNPISKFVVNKFGLSPEMINNLIENPKILGFYKENGEIKEITRKNIEDIFNNLNEKSEFILNTDKIIQKSKLKGLPLDIQEKLEQSLLSNLGFLKSDNSLVFSPTKTAIDGMNIKDSKLYEALNNKFKKLAIKNFDVMEHLMDIVELNESNINRLFTPDIVYNFRDSWIKDKDKLVLEIHSEVEDKIIDILTEQGIGRRIIPKYINQLSENFELYKMKEISDIFLGIDIPENAKKEIENLLYEGEKKKEELIYKTRNLEKLKFDTGPSFLNKLPEDKRKKVDEILEKYYSDSYLYKLIERLKQKIGKTDEAGHLIQMLNLNHVKTSLPTRALDKLIIILVALKENGEKPENIIRFVLNTFGFHPITYEIFNKFIKEN